MNKFIDMLLRHIFIYAEDNLDDVFVSLDKLIVDAIEEYICDDSVPRDTVVDVISEFLGFLDKHKMSFPLTRYTIYSLLGISRSKLLTMLGSEEMFLTKCVGAICNNISGIRFQFIPNNPHVQKGLTATATFTPYTSIAYKIGLSSELFSPFAVSVIEERMKHRSEYQDIKVVYDTNMSFIYFTQLLFSDDDKFEITSSIGVVSAVVKDILDYQYKLLSGMIVNRKVINDNAKK